MTELKVKPQILVVLAILHLITLTTIMGSFVPLTESTAIPTLLNNELFISEDPLIKITHDDNFTTMGFTGRVGLLIEKDCASDCPAKIDDTAIAAIAIETVIFLMLKPPTPIID